MTAYYNEIDPGAAAWLRELIKQGHIADGDVDTRSIADVAATELDGYTQCHFFAGIGGWSYALRLAGWPDDRPVWTGSCPCQPFSNAGEGAGFADERHLWPAWFWLISQRLPRVIFGEQVASPDGLAWLDLVLADLEGAHYAGTPVDLCAAGIGAPHIRQRLWFVAERLAESDGGRCSPRRIQGRGEADEAGARSAASLCGGAVPGRMGDASGPGVGWNGGAVPRAKTEGGAQRIVARDLGDRAVAAGSAGGPWGGVDWLPCRDGKLRPIESGLEPLAHGVPARVGRLRGYGNAIVPQVAAEVIGAYMDVSGVSA